MFLPDRFVKGTCPKCKAEDQYGDNCEVCASTYSPMDLINPRSAVSGTTPIVKESEHFFFDLPAFEGMLKEWTRSGSLQSEIANKMQEWFESDLQQWDISRDAPYFGFEIPGAKDKFFYVWLDAPIGYMASFKIYAIVKALISMNFGLKAVMQSFIISSVKTSFISTAYSGLQCLKAVATVNRLMCSLMAMSLWMGRRCQNLAAHSFKPALI